MNYQKIVELAQSVAHHDAKNLFKQFPRSVKTIIKKELWAERDKDGNPFTSFQAFAEHRLWQGLEIPMDRLMRYCEDDEEAIRLLKEELPEAGGQGGTGANQFTKMGEADESRQDNIRSANSYGTSAAHTLSRLKRDHPEIAKEVIDGNLTANAGAIKAGIRQPKAQMVGTPEGIQRWLKTHLPEWRLVNVETGEFAEGSD